MKALLVYPTHENCREAEQDCLAAGLNAGCYPGRTTNTTTARAQNCRNSQADDAERIGFSVVKTVCPTCPERSQCLSSGYLGELAAVKHVSIAICTHKRAEYNGFETLAKDRSYISVHEDPVSLVRPRLSICEQDLVLAQHTLGLVLNDPQFLDWFGTALRVDDEGVEYPDAELALRKERQYQFCRHMADLIDDLIKQLQATQHTREWRAHVCYKRPDGIERTLFFATRAAHVRFTGPAWRFVLAAASGELACAAIIVSERRRKGGGQKVAHLVRSIIGVQNNFPPTTATVWFNDATLTCDRLKTVLGHCVQDKTPRGHLELQKKAVQIHRDVTRRTSRRIVGNLLRGVMADRPQFQNIGVICHSNHMSVLETLAPEFASRIIKSTYFGSGEERSSNDWHTQCDLIIVMGTPRVPPAEVAAYLVQVGEIGAASRKPEWGPLHWNGQAENGGLVKITGAGYQDDDWRRAHRDLVRSQLVQAVGRGRGILETGCEVLMLSNEECGLAISDAPLETLNQCAERVLRVMRELGASFPNKDYLGKLALKSSEIASRAKISPRHAQRALQELERRGLVRRVGERLGWLPVIPAADEADSRASAQQE